MAKSKAQREQEEIKQVAKRLFATDDGQKYLNHLMRRFHVMTSTFDPDPSVHSFCEGERNAVVYIIDQIAETPDEYRKRYEDVKTQSTLEWGED